MLNTKNEKYLKLITEAVKEVAKESQGPIAIYVRDELKSSGAMYFFKNAGDDRELTYVETMERKFLNLPLGNLSLMS